MKEKLKEWNREVQGNIIAEKGNLSREIDTLDRLEIAAPMSGEQWESKVDGETL